MCILGFIVSPRSHFHTHPNYSGNTFPPYCHVLTSENHDISPATEERSISYLWLSLSVKTWGRFLCCLCEKACSQSNSVKLEHAWSHHANTLWTWQQAHVCTHMHTCAHMCTPPQSAALHRSICYTQSLTNLSWKQLLKHLVLGSWSPISSTLISPLTTGFHSQSRPKPYLE